jgi:hypothetical protein
VIFIFEFGDDEIFGVSCGSMVESFFEGEKKTLEEARHGCRRGK